VTAKREITEPRDAKKEVADWIIPEIEKGALPWKREWNPERCTGPQAPFNPVTKHGYRGINVLILGMSFLAYQMADPRWLTFLQAKEKGWHVKKGERSTTIFFTKNLNVKDEDAEDGERTIRLLRHYPVFHASQVEGIPPYVPPTVEEAPWTRPEAVQIIMQNSGVSFTTGGDRAFYSPAGDFIQLPPDIAFPRPEYWAATAIHEINHSTGHPTRMNRELSGAFGSESYACEEARVEMAAAFVCNILGLPTDYANHAAYIATWLKKHRTDKYEMFRCAADAQRIADWTLAYHPEYAARDQAQRPDFRPEPGPPEPLIL
jgi:antirestriction protein ArdC